MDMIMEWMRSVNPQVLMWLAFLIIFLVVELISVGLTSIWFAAGALCAMLLAVFGNDSLLAQILVFLVVSVALLAVTRPFARKFINSRTQRTNVEQLVGERIQISERVSNIDQTGRAVVHGLEWNVRTEEDGLVLEEGDMAEIVRISGVKLIVKRV